MEAARANTIIEEMRVMGFIALRLNRPGLSPSLTRLKNGSRLFMNHLRFTIHKEKIMTIISNLLKINWVKIQSDSIIELTSRAKIGKLAAISRNECRASGGIFISSRRL